jgi:hypothetical protein
MAFTRLRDLLELKILHPTRSLTLWLGGVPGSRCGDYITFQAVMEQNFIGETKIFEGTGRHAGVGC